MSDQAPFRRDFPIGTLVFLGEEPNRTVLGILLEKNEQEPGQGTFLVLQRNGELSTSNRSFRFLCTYQQREQHLQNLWTRLQCARNSLLAKAKEQENYAQLVLPLEDL